MPKIYEREFFPDSRGVHHLPEGNRSADYLNLSEISIGVTVAIVGGSLDFLVEIGR